MKPRPVFAAACAAIALVVSGPAFAQDGGFEVASITPSAPNPSGPLGGSPMVLPALGRFEVVGGPSWLNTNTDERVRRAWNQRAHASWAP